MNFFSKVKPFFPLSLMQSACLNAFMGVVLTVVSLEIVHTNFLHPLWVLAFYFLTYTTVKIAINYFVPTKNVALVYQSLVALLRMGTGILIVVIASVHDDNLGLLWIGFFGFFFYFGFTNLIKVDNIQTAKADEKAQKERLDPRGSEFQYARAQYAREILERNKQAAEAQRREDALLADLAEFFTDTGQ